MAFGRPGGLSSKGLAGPAAKSSAGRTRVCPHCKATILESASVCPGCQHHLRFDPSVEAQKRTASTFSPLKVEGRVDHPAGAGAWEYSVVLIIRNERGEELTRKVVGVGALQETEARTFSLAVEVTAVNGPSQK